MVTVASERHGFLVQSDEAQPAWLRLAARSTGRSVAWAAAVGIVGSALYRLFMALLADQPEFTWTGTLLITGSVTAVAVLVALCARARATSDRRTAVGVLRVVTALSFALLMQAQGILMVPVWVLGGLALGRVDAPRVLRWIGFGLAGAAAVGFVVYGSTVDHMTVAKLAPAAVLYLVIAAVHALGFSVAVGSPARRTDPWQA